MKHNRTEFVPRNLVSERMNPIDIGFIVLNPKYQRNDYIDLCNKTHTVDIVLKDGTYYEQCVLASPSLSFEDGIYEGVRFPENVGEIGNAVVVVFANASRKPIIIAFLPSLETVIVLDRENQSKQIKESEECSISIIKDPKDGTLLFNVVGKQAGKGKLKINVSNDNEDAEVDVRVQGSLKAYASKNIDLQAEERFQVTLQDLQKQDKKTTLKYELTTGLEIIDEFENVVKLNSGGLEVVSKKVLNIQINGNATLNSKGKTIVNGKNVEIGSAASLALNVDTICQYSGQKHFSSPTNIKTKV